MLASSKDHSVQEVQTVLVVLNHTWLSAVSRELVAELSDDICQTEVANEAVNIMCLATKLDLT